MHMYVCMKMFLYHLKSNNKINPSVSTIQIKKQNT